MRLSLYYGAALWLLVSSTAVAQTEADTVKHWKKKLKFALNVNQSSFSSNWTGGGVNSIGLNSLFNYQANYQKNKSSWNNEIDLLYGFVNNQGQGFRKTLDRILIDSKYGHKLSDKWNLFTSMTFLTQFAPGYKYDKDVNGVEQASLISDIFAPAFITSAWGLEYVPATYFKLRLSPFAPRITIVNDPERFVPTVSNEPYGVVPPDNTRFEWLAFQAQAEFNKDIAENLNLNWRYMMFMNYETLAFNKIDHRLELGMTAKVNKFFNVGFGAILLYDYDQIDEVQLSQVFTLGFLYTFQNFKDAK